eukprot:1921282-Rhodomonas_salina.1
MPIVFNTASLRGLWQVLVIAQQASQLAFEIVQGGQSKNQVYECVVAKCYKCSSLFFWCTKKGSRKPVLLPKNTEGVMKRLIAKYTPILAALNVVSSPHPVALLPSADMWPACPRPPWTRAGSQQVELPRRTSFWCRSRPSWTSSRAMIVLWRASTGRTGRRSAACSSPAQRTSSDSARWTRSLTPSARPCSSRSISRWWAGQTGLRAVTMTWWRWRRKAMDRGQLAPSAGLGSARLRRLWQVPSVAGRRKQGPVESLG